MDPFLSQFNRVEKIDIIRAFAFTVRNNEFGRTSKTELRGDTVHATINYVAKTFREEGFEDPTLEASGKSFIGLQRQIRGYTDLDPATNKQSCIPLHVFNHMIKTASDPLQLAIAQLTIGALFFAMRSCKYSHTNGDKNINNCKTKLLKVRNIKFYSKHKELDIFDQGAINSAKSVIITFKFQKNRTKFQSIKQDQNSSNLCAVKIWATIVSRILSYPKGNINSSINMVRTGRSYQFIKSTTIRSNIRKTVETIGKTKLGFSKDTVGTKSLRSTFAMLLYLNKIPTETIKRMGRWKSDAVFEYVRANVEAFSKDKSANIAKATTGNFYTLPTYIATIKI